jgi:RND family efflux transporter MFP subunit
VAVLTRRAGIVRRILAERGESVRAGQVLCELESEDLALALDVARLTAEKARADFERSSRLQEEGAVSREAHESAEFRLRSAEREEEIARHELEKASVRAPFDGVVSARNVEIGQVLAEDDPRVLFRVTAGGPLLARVFVPQWAYPHVHEGDRAVLHPSGAAGPGASARVAWVNDVLDPASGSAEVLVEVPAAGPEGLRPGMEVSVEIEARAPPGRLTVPRSAVRFSPALPSEGEVILAGAAAGPPRRVRLGFEGDDRVEILSGLAEGEVVLVPAGGEAAPGRGGP